jgi:hypothetical protein
VYSKRSRAKRCSRGLTTVSHSKRIHLCRFASRQWVITKVLHRSSSHRPWLTTHHYNSLCNLRATLQPSPPLRYLYSLVTSGEHTSSLGHLHVDHGPNLASTWSYKMLSFLQQQEDWQKQQLQTSVQIQLRLMRLLWLITSSVRFFKLDPGIP